MKVILFGATGRVGQGVLRECLLDLEVDFVLSIVRATPGQRRDKLRELVRTDFFHFADIEKELAGFDVCFFCLGVTSSGKSEEEYRRVTYDVTMAVGETLANLNQGMTFIYVSGTGTDSSERGRVMWARVKGKTENALLRLPFKDAYMFRLGVIQPLHGITSKTRSYRIFYSLTAPVLPLLKAMLPNYVTTTEQVGRAMLKVAGLDIRSVCLKTKTSKAFESVPPLVRDSGKA
jgi:uncharacterized protein YbjT (DUF2867 family)